MPGEGPNWGVEAPLWSPQSDPGRVEGGGVVPVVGEVSGWRHQAVRPRQYMFEYIILCFHLRFFIFFYCITPLAWVEIQCFALTAYMPMCLHVHLRASLHAYMLTRLHAYTLTCMCVHVCTLIHDCVSTCLRANMFTCDPM